MNSSKLTLAGVTRCSRTTLVGRIAFITILAGITGCKNQAPPSPTTTQNPTPTQPAPGPTPTKPPCPPGQHCFAFADTPITVAGSSIHIVFADNTKVSLPTTNPFILTANNSRNLKYNGVQGFPPSEVINGWTIVISNRKRQPPPPDREKPDALVIRSISANNVSFRLRGDLWMEPIEAPDSTGSGTHTEFVLHDIDCDGPIAPHAPEGQCDFLLKVKMQGHNGGKCSTSGIDGKCSIEIGTP
jgi:hypothetical protein